MNDFRIEEDPLGSTKVPIDAYCGFPSENLIRPEFRGKVFAPDAGSGTLPQSVTR